MTHRYFRPLLILAALVLESACQAVQTPIATYSSIPPTVVPTDVNSAQPPYRTISVAGQFVFAPGDGSIWLQDASTYQAKPLLKSNGVEYYESPSFSPDGSQIVFVAYTFDSKGTQIKQVRVMSSDGTGMRTLFQAPSDGPRMYLSDPRYSPDGASIYFGLTTVTGQTIKEQKNQIVRGPASGGSWKVVLEDAERPSPSSDGLRIAYLNLNPDSFSAALWVANVDGSGAHQLVADNVFAGILGQHFSPDGKWIVFAASGAPRNPLPSMAVRSKSTRGLAGDSCLLGFLWTCLVQRAHADGLPWDIWLMAADGKTFKQLTMLGLDSPYPVFSKDGRYVAFICINGLFIYDRNTSQISLLDKERAHGVMDWFQK